MSNGIILSYFDEQKGFVPVLNVTSDRGASLIKDIVFRATLNLVGGAKNISEERESFIDFPDHQLIGCSYLKSVESPSIRGGRMPIILILFTSNVNRVYVYSNLLQIMGDLKNLMEKILPYWKDTKFTNINVIKSFLHDYKSKIDNISLSDSLDKSGSQEKKFIVKCPECSQEVSVLIPRQIPDLLTISITNAPCKHTFDAYFTKGPEFRGTSEKRSESDKNNGLKDIFNNL
ncbi:MAG: hypothetical protein EU531_10410 [Promethearchaeota archaeon]|nr:MAG: hypothetical protein EU531_10410 [Candidatus Lokiarchaeota archaeon]